MGRVLFTTLFLFAAGGAHADLPPTVDSYVTDYIGEATSAQSAINSFDAANATATGQRVQDSGISKANSYAGGGAQAYLNQAAKIDDGIRIMTVALNACVAKAKAQVAEAKAAVEAAKNCTEESDDEGEDTSDGPSCADQQKAAQDALDKAEANLAACSSEIGGRIAQATQAGNDARAAAKAAGAVSVKAAANTGTQCSEGSGGMRCIDYAKGTTKLYPENGAPITLPYIWTGGTKVSATGTGFQIQGVDRLTNLPPKNQVAEAGEYICASGSLEGDDCGGGIMGYEDVIGGRLVFVPEWPGAEGYYDLNPDAYE